MPIYEYHCNSCGYDMEIFHRKHGEELSVCEHCSSKEVVRKMSLSQFKLNGSGWYQTDYARLGGHSCSGGGCCGSGGCGVKNG